MLTVVADSSLCVHLDGCGSSAAELASPRLVNSSFFFGARNCFWQLRARRAPAPAVAVDMNKNGRGQTEQTHKFVSGRRCCCVGRVGGVASLSTDRPPAKQKRSLPAAAYGSVLRRNLLNWSKGCLRTSVERPGGWGSRKGYLPPGRLEGGRELRSGVWSGDPA